MKHGLLPIFNLKQEEAGLRQFFFFLLLGGCVLFYLSLFAPISAKSCNNIFFAGILLPTIILTRATDWKNLLRLPWLNIYFFLILYLVLSHAWSPQFSSENFIRFLKRGIYIYGFFLALYLVRTRFIFTANMITGWIGITALLLSAPLAILILNYTPSARMEGSGQFSNSNDMAILSAALVGIALHQWQVSSLAQRWILGTSLAILLACIALSHSRSGLAALIACMLCAVILRRKTSFGIAILVIATAVIWLPGSDIWLERGFSFRDGIWQINWQRFNDCGFLGCGLGTSTKGVVNGKVIVHTHSVLFSMLFHGGIIALALYLILIGSALLRAFFISPSIVPGMLLLAGFIGTLATNDQILITPNPLWVYLLAPLALICFKSQSSSNGKLTSQ